MILYVRSTDISFRKMQIFILFYALNIFIYTHELQ